MSLLSARKTSLFVGPQGPPGPSGQPGSPGQTGPAATTGQTNLTLVNGLNSDVNPGGNAMIRATGPTLPFSLGGFVGGTPGKIQGFFNTTQQQLSLVHEDASSSAVNRLALPTGYDVSFIPAQAACLFQYDGTLLRWVPMGLGAWKPRNCAKVLGSDFGMKGDSGTTDNSPRFNATIAAAVATVTLMSGGHGFGCDVEIDAGDFYFNSPVAIINDTAHGNPTGIRIVGTCGGSAGTSIATRFMVNFDASPTSGSAASIATNSTHVLSVTGLGANVPLTSWVGRAILITNSATYGLNGAWIIQTVNSAAGSITINCSAQTADASGTVHWKILQPFISLQSSDCIFRNIHFDVAAGHNCYCHVQSTRAQTAGAQESTNNQFYDCTFSAASTGLLACGVTLGDQIAVGGVISTMPPDCENNLFWKCGFGGFVEAGFKCYNTTGQSKNIQFIHGGASGALYNSASGGWYGCRWFQGSACYQDFSFGSVHNCIAIALPSDSNEVWSCDAEHCGRLFITDIGGGASSPLPLTIIGGRFDTSDLVNTQTSFFGSSDGIFINIAHPGMTIIGANFAGPQQDTFRIVASPACAGNKTILHNCAFPNGNGIYPFGAAGNTNSEFEVRGCSSFNSAFIPDADIVYAGSGAVDNTVGCCKSYYRPQTIYSSAGPHNIITFKINDLASTTIHARAKGTSIGANHNTYTRDFEVTYARNSSTAAIVGSLKEYNQQNNTGASSWSATGTIDGGNANQLDIVITSDGTDQVIWSAECFAEIEFQNKVFYA